MNIYVAVVGQYETAMNWTIGAYSTVENAVAALEQEMDTSSKVLDYSCIQTYALDGLKIDDDIVVYQRETE
jgi:hypothetical protein